MSLNMDAMVKDYLQWLETEMQSNVYEKGYGIVTPFLNSANDYIEIYVDTSEDTIILTDDGDTLYDLKMSGVNITKARRRVIDSILNRYGMYLKDDVLFKDTTRKDFSQAKHTFIQAVLSVNDMIYTSQRHVQSFFLDDVKDYFDENEIFYTPDVSFTGASGFPHSYDFVFQRNKHKPTRYAKAINRPNRQQVESFAFAWDDTLRARREHEIRQENDSYPIVLLNDESSISDKVIQSFDKLNITALKWSDRDSNIFREHVS